MAVDKRATRVYYYTYFGKRDTGTSIRKYLGHGVLGQLLEETDAAHREAHRQRWRRERNERDEISTAVRLSCLAIVAIKQIVTAEMAMQGVFQHARGEWRRRQGGQSMATGSRTKRAGAKAKAKRNQAADAPNQAQIGDAFDLAGLATAAWIKLLAGDDVLAAETIRKQLTSWRDELLRDGSSPLERVCVQRVVLCRLEAETTDAKYISSPSCSMVQAKFLVERRHAAERRLAVALRTLAVVRKMN